MKSFKYQLIVVASTSSICMAQLLFHLLLLSVLVNGTDFEHACECMGPNNEIEDCACDDLQSLDQFNEKKMLARLRSLLDMEFFQFYQINLKKPCEFWQDDGKCSLKDCVVKTCDMKSLLVTPIKATKAEKSLPENLKRQEEIKNGDLTQQEINSRVNEHCEEEEKLSGIDTFVSKEEERQLEDWRRFDTEQTVNFCEPEDESSSDLEFVNLSLNPERFTGYQGSSAHRVWGSIYNENCFFRKPTDIFPPSRPPAQCKEESTFFSIISGFHTSINIHVIAQKYQPEKSFLDQKVFGPDLESFRWRFHPVNEPAGPERIRNMYFLFSLEMRALVKVIPYLQANFETLFYTGDRVGDSETLQAVKAFLRLITTASSSLQLFEEKLLFSEGQSSQVKGFLLDEFKARFQNISRILDCVGCDKCKMWAKLQIRGIGTALKILFSPPGLFKLERQEIVAFFHSLGKVSTGIKEIRDFKKQLIDEKSNNGGGKGRNKIFGEL